jgi:integrase/recombinase XerC
MSTSEIILTHPLPLDQNPAAVYIASLGSETGRRSQAQALRAIAQCLNMDLEQIDWSAMRYQHTAAIRSRIISAYAPATANKILSALRQTLKQAWLLGQMSAEQYHRAVELDPVKGETLPAGRELSRDEIKALLDACQADENRNAGIRDMAIIALMYSTGLRREEVCKLDVSDCNGGQIKVTGKRNKQRTAYFNNGALDALNTWLAVRGMEPGALFLAVDKHGSLYAGNLSSQAIYNILKKRAAHAGIENISPHDLRRTNTTHLLMAGADISVVAGLLGHADIRTTRKYDRRGEDSKREAAALLTIPG